MSYVIKFRELQEEAMKTGLTLDTNSIEEMAKKIEQYVCSLPEPLRNYSVISIGGRRVKRVDYPRLFREDPEFRQIFLQMLTAGKR
ncbi:MAG: hypothetical protein QW575_04770 [Thermoproteota archaeon]